MILLDQGTKWLIVSKMQYGESIKMIQDFIYITSHRNRGAAFGILQGKMWLFFIITAVVVVAVIFYLQKYGRKEPLLGTSLALILGGAIGNFIDRLFRGEVVDFIDVKIFSYDYPIFNIADSALVIGVILMIIYTIRDGREQKETF
ncbi:signal peptidase II [Massilibacterium senegalense]|uniref:signal peptidase II n=1 Tax=Massilibacterium senegalense TaxID=1632858 RepID=UPI0038990814